ncbi:MAG: histidinol-phosphate transaminase [Nitrososphaeraceae archaeon]
MIFEKNFTLCLDKRGQLKNQCFHGGIYSVDPSLVKIDFSSNINPLGISKKVLAVIKKNLVKISSEYPDPECTDFKRSLIDHLNHLNEDVSFDCISVGNGANELIHNFAQSFVKNEVVIPVPTYCEYQVASKRMGAKINSVELKNWDFDADEIIHESKRSDAIFLCNPNNPTGLLSKSITKIIENTDSSKKILIDESFFDLIDAKHKTTSFIGKINEFKNIVVLRSMTKSFGLAGLRLGYCVSHQSISKKLLANRIYWNVNGLAQLAGAIALTDRTYLREAIKLIKMEREFLQNQFRHMSSFSCLPSDVNYLLIKSKKLSSNKIHDLLLKNSGILVRDCSTFKGLDKKYIRVAVKLHKDNLLLLRSLKMLDN